MKQKVIFILLNEFADWEGAYLAPALTAGVEPGRPAKYEVKIMSLTKEPIVSIGGMKVVPDYDMQTIPSDYAGLVLVGGMQWFNPEVQQLVSLVEDAVKRGKVVAGICNASVFLGMHGFLDTIRHTSNTLEYLKKYAGDKYKGDNHYVNEQAVRDGNIVTANGTASLEFTREVLYALEADEPDKIEGFYNFHKLGFCEMLQHSR